MKRVVILDLNSILYRFYFKLPGMRSSSGEPTGALYGLANTLITLKEKFNPDYFIAALDSKRKDLNRKKIYSDYKASRSKAPNELASQISKSSELLEAFGVTSIQKDGYEADDVIASYVDFFSGNDIFVMTSDKDLMQLVPKAKIVRSNFDVVESEEEVKAALGVIPNKIVDLFALQGDSSDGIPGVKGIGPKSAVKLIEQFDNIENMLENIDKLKGSVKSKIENNIEIMKLSKELATLNSFNVTEAPQYKGSTPKLEAILEQLEFRSLYKKLGIIKEEIEIKLKEVDKIILKERSTVLLIKDIYYMLNDKEVISSKNIDFNSQIVDTYDAKVLYKKHDIALGIDNMITFHLIFSEERADLKRAIKRVFGLSVDSPELLTYYCGELTKYSLKELDKLKIYDSIEKPLIKVLAKMEAKGVSIDKKYLEEYGEVIVKKLDDLKEKIESEAGEKFNIASPKQLSKILFEKLNLPTVKKTKTGFSTDNEVLEALSRYDIVKYLLEYRKYSKLLSTYILPLKKDRVFTTYNQNGTATGRLSSTNPNLQNIPSRTAEGLLIRKAFISSRAKLLVLDYSQIELRILASLSQDKNLLAVYRNREDLHNTTAEKIFGIVDRNTRYRAKIINFSLIYGKSAFGLAKEINTTVLEASQYISKYFEEYSGVKSFIEKTVLEAKHNGYVETMFGRKRILSDINSGNKNLRSAAERAAVNTIIQGTQAEIIKKAMINIMEYIKDKEIDMVMQVHDELVLEVEDDSCIEDIKRIMRDAVKLDVDLEVNAYLVDNWAEAK